MPDEFVNIARCPEHGLHGERIRCFECHGPVEQVPMIEILPGRVAVDLSPDQAAWLEQSARFGAAQPVFPPEAAALDALSQKLRQALADERRRASASEDRAEEQHLNRRDLITGEPHRSGPTR